MRNCVLPAKPGKKFQMTVSSKSMVNVLNRVDLVTKFSEADDSLTNVHLLVACEGQVFVIGRTPDTFIAHWVDGATSSADGAINVDPKQLKGLIDKREEVVLDYDGSAVTVTATKGKYTAVFKTKALSVEQIPLVQEGLRHHVDGGHKIDGDVMGLIRQGISMTKMKDIYTPSNPVICRIIADGSNLTIGSMTHWHASRFQAPLPKSKKAKREFRFSLSVQMFDLLNRVVDGQPAQFSADVASFSAESDTFVLVLPPIQSSDSDYSIIDSYFESLKEKPLISAVFSSGLSSALTNIGSFVSKKEKPSLTMTIGPKTAAIAFSNDAGSVSDSIKIKSSSVDSKHPVRMDYTLLCEVLKLLPDSASGQSFAVYGNSIKELKMFNVAYKTPEFSVSHIGYLPQ